MRNTTCILAFCSSLGVAVGQSHAQTTQPSVALGRRFYLGLEGVIFANRPTQFTQAAPGLSAADKDLAPRPAVVAGYQATPRLAVELRAQALPVLTGYRYQQELATAYLGFGESYTQEYLYLPLKASWRVTKPATRLALAIVAGGGPAWTETGGQLLTPTGTQYFTSSGTTIGTGSSPGPGAVTATVTQQLTQQQGFFMGFEAGLSGTWQVRPRLGVSLAVRQLWSTASSARTIQLAIQTDAQALATTMRTPVQGICTGLSAYYFL
jgi:hypothetical protein